MNDIIKPADKYNIRLYADDIGIVLHGIYIYMCVISLTMYEIILED